MQHAPGFLALVQEVLPRICEITPQMLAQESCILIDVREESEWANGHISGAVHIGRGVLERDIEANIPDKQANIVLYCGGGYRSALAADSLQKMGYTNVRSLAGGWKAWRAGGFPRA